MENRLNVRIPLQLPVQLWTADGAASGTTVDLSFEGMRVQMHADRLLPWGRVWVCFEPEAVGISVAAVAMRQDGMDLGLMFEGYDEAVDEYLTDRLSEALDHVNYGHLRAV